MTCVDGVDCADAEFVSTTELTRGGLLNTEGSSWPIMVASDMSLMLSKDRSAPLANSKAPPSRFGLLESGRVNGLVSACCDTEMPDCGNCRWRVNGNVPARKAGWVSGRWVVL